MFNTILQWAGYITAISAALAVVGRIFAWQRKLAEGQKCILRSDMLRIYYRHQDGHEIRQYEYENFVKCYEAYKALGGNSFIDKVHSEVKEWEVRS